jgi:ATP-dependent HslUV protease subunit HslV
LYPATATATAVHVRDLSLPSPLSPSASQLLRASVELAKEWRSDKHLRRMLNAVLVVADKDVSLTLSGNGDVLEHADGVCGIGSGGIYAQCAALALKDIPVRQVSICSTGDCNDFQFP